MKAFKYIFFIVIVVFGFTLSKCNKNSGDCDPNKFCDTLPYDSGYVNIQASFNGKGIPIIIYESSNSIENILFYDTMWAVENSYYLSINKRYAVEAFYQEANNLIIALDGDKLKENTFWNCEEQCYELPEVTLDVKKL